MRQVSWAEIDALIDQAEGYIGDPWLDSLPAQFGEEYHCYYRLLYRLIEELQPPAVLEVGVYFGVASAFMCAAAAAYGGQVVGIDIESKGLPRDELPSRFGNYTYLLGNSVDPVVAITALSFAPFCLVFQDSSHHFYPSLGEWQLYSPWCQGLWLCDDITPAFHDPKVDPPGMGMVQYWETLPNDKRLYPDILHRGNTMGVVRCS